MKRALALSAVTAVTDWLLSIIRHLLVDQPRALRAGEFVDIDLLNSMSIINAASVLDAVRVSAAPTYSVELIR